MKFAPLRCLSCDTDLVKMSETRGDERSFFGNIARNQTKYGSTTKPAPKYTKYVVHTVSRVDTLMGLALKYEATVEQIKRENKLWTNDSLFLRKFLYIPITIDNSHLVQDDWELLSSDEVRARSNSDGYGNSASPGHRSEQDHSRACCSVNGANSDCIARDSKLVNGGTSGSDFFSKYDSSLASLKDKVEHLEKTSSYAKDDLASLIPRRHSDIPKSTRKSRSVSLENPDSPVLVIKSNSKAHRVQSAVKRSEAAQDSLFEL